MALSLQSLVCSGHSTYRGTKTPSPTSHFTHRNRVVCSRKRVASAAETISPHVQAPSTIGGGAADDVRLFLPWRISSNPVLATALALCLSFNGMGTAEARPVGVNRPELLPESFTPVIDAAGFLSAGQEVRIVKEVTNLEEETGFKLRVLAQNYPNTPGLAIKDFWKVDDNTIVFVADPSLGGNILNFNVGAAVDLSVPRSFWTRLAGKYGNMFYWQEKGEDASIEAAVSAISTCLREPPGPRACSSID